MFRPLRRASQALTLEECIQILKRESTMVLGVSGDDEYPYTVPLNFVYTDPDAARPLGTIGFHCAVSGHKLDAIRRDEKVSVCVISRDKVNAPLRATDFESVIAFGKARILTEPDELRKAALKIGDKYARDYRADCEAETEDTIRRGTLACVEITLEHISGKRAKHLMR